MRREKIKMMMPFFFPLGVVCCFETLLFDFVVYEAKAYPKTKKVVSIYNFCLQNFLQTRQRFFYYLKKKF